MARRYKHSEAFAEVKAIEEDIKINLTSLQYLQILDYYLWNSLRFLINVSPTFFTCYLSKVIAYQQVHSMSKLSSESRETITNNFFNYVTTGDIEWVKKLYLNRGLYFGIISYWLSKSNEYFQLRSPFNEREDAPKRMYEIANELSITDTSVYYANYKQVAYWFSKAQDFKSKIMQKYVRMTILQAQKAYVEYNHEIDLDDVTQIYLQIMSKAIDRCDSRFGVLTTFIQSWLKSAKAIVQKMVQSKQHSTSYEGLIEEFGDSADVGVTSFDDSFDTLQELAYAAQKIDTTGCLRIMYKIPQFMSLQNRKLLEDAWG